MFTDDRWYHFIFVVVAELVRCSFVLDLMRNTLGVNSLLLVSGKIGRLLPLLSFLHFYLTNKTSCRLRRPSFYPRPVLAFGYCRCLRLSVCTSVCAVITCLSAR